MKLIYHPAAEAELVAAARFYEERVKGLGIEFLDEFEQCMTMILAAPERWRVVRGDKRRFLMPRFPYGLYYRVAGDEVACWSSSITASTRIMEQAGSEGCYFTFLSHGICFRL